MNSPSIRWLIAAMALLLSLAGGFIYWQGDRGGGGVLVRSGLVLGAVWLAWPALAALAFAVTRPALLIWILPALLVFALLRRRQAR